MFVAWIVITLMVALVIGVIGSVLNDIDRFEGFIVGFMLPCIISFGIGVAYVLEHFISKYW